jgi:hypothetical protein
MTQRSEQNERYVLKLRAEAAEKLLEKANKRIEDVEHINKEMHEKLKKIREYAADYTIALLNVMAKNIEESNALMIEQFHAIQELALVQRKWQRDKPEDMIEDDEEEIDLL